MLAKLIQSLFPEGQRKVMVSLIAILVGAILDKFAGGLTDNMEHILIGAVAIFTGGNIFEHIKGMLAGTKVGQMIEDIMPGDQGLMPEVAKPEMQMAQAASNAVNVANNVVGQAMDAVGKRFEALEQRLTVQAQNQAKLVEFINKMTATAQARNPAPQRPQEEE
jgi:hypothetical protein